MTRGAWLAIGAGVVAATTLAAAVVIDVLGPSDREQDCAEVRAILAPAPAQARRYWDYSEAAAKAATRPQLSPRERLKELPYRDADVRDAVLEYIGADENSGWTLYTPYTTNASPTAGDKLRALCGVPHQIVIEAR